MINHNLLIKLSKYIIILLSYCESTNAFKIILTHFLSLLLVLPHSMFDVRSNHIGLGPILDWLQLLIDLIYIPLSNYPSTHSQAIIGLTGRNICIQSCNIGCSIIPQGILTHVTASWSVFKQQTDYLLSRLLVFVTTLYQHVLQRKVSRKKCILVV